MLAASESAFSCDARMGLREQKCAQKQAVCSRECLHTVMLPDIAVDLAPSFHILSWKVGESVYPCDRFKVESSCVRQRNCWRILAVPKRAGIRINGARSRISRLGIADRNFDCDCPLQRECESDIPRDVHIDMKYRPRTWSQWGLLSFERKYRLFHSELWLPSYTDPSYPQT